MPFTRDRWPQKGNCFVLIPFGKHELRDGTEFDWDEHYHDVIEETIRQAGMTPLRADNLYGSGTLLDKLWQGIQEAEVIIADLTGRSANVLYEIGLAHVIGKRMIILTMYPDDVPVDLQQFAVNPYTPGKGLLQLTRNLQKQLEAARKEPPAEAMLMPLRGAGIEEIAAKVLSVMPTFAMVEARDGRKGFLGAEDVSWARYYKDLTKARELQVKELKGAFVVDANGQQKYSLTFGDNPWPKLEKEFPVNSELKSAVVNVREGIGAWVNMNYGIQGFIPQGQLPRDVAKGTPIRARVVEINQAKREVTLQFVDIPRDVPMDRTNWPFHRGLVLEGRAERMFPEKGYAFIRVSHEGRTLTGMLHNSKMSLALRERFFAQELRSGDPVMVEVLDSDPSPPRPRISFRDLPSAAFAVSETQSEILQEY